MSQMCHTLNWLVRIGRRRKRRLALLWNCERLLSVLRHHLHLLLWLLIVAVTTPSLEALVCNAKRGAVFHAVANEIFVRGMAPASTSRVTADGDERVVAATSHVVFGIEMCVE